MTAKAAVFMGAHKNFEVKDFEITQTPDGYGRSQLIASGICGTDLHFHNGKLTVSSPSIIGHEFVGRLIDANEKEAKEYGLSIGDAVIADIAIPCGKCLLCKNGDEANCVNMKMTNSKSINEAPYLYGGYTQVNYTPLSNLIKIPEEIDPVTAATFACPGPTAIHAFSLAEKAGVKLSEINSAVVQGLGPVGVFAIMYMKKQGIKHIFAITTRKNTEREKAALLLGAERVFNLTTEGTEVVTKELQEKNNGLGIDLCFEASGSPQAVKQGLDILRNRGVYLIPGQYSNSNGIEIQPQLITFKALHIIGSSQYSVNDVKKYLEFLKNNQDLYPLISNLSIKYPIEEINEAIEEAKKGNKVKTLLVMK